MSKPSLLVFLSCAQRDREAARHLAEALRGFGLEVWLDPDAPTGGDAWVQQTRDRIEASLLFVPLISAHTNLPDEGYVRIEWKLAQECARHRALGASFLLPVLIDDTPVGEARVPDAFRAVPWTLLPGGQAPASDPTRLRRELQARPVELRPPDGNSGVAAAGPETAAEPAGSREPYAGAESELKLFRALIDRSRDAIHVVDPVTARFIDVNESGCRDLGYTRAELLALTVPDVTVGVDQAAFAAHTASLRTTGHATIEVWQRRQDGTTYPVEVSLSLITHGREYVVATVRDISERKRHEDRLALLNTALLAAPNSVVITDERGTIEWANPAFIQLTGYTSAEIVGQNPRVLKSGRHPPEYYAELWRTITSGRNWHGELINKRKDGSIYLEDATIAPVRDADGVIRHFVAIKHDITARKRDEARLHEQAELLDKASDCIVVTGLDQRIRFWNRGAERVFGYTASAALGHTTEDLGLIRDAGQLRAARTATATHGEWHGELSLRDRQGQPLVMDTRLTLIRDASGHPTGQLNISTDVSERKKLQEQFLRVQRLESIGMLATGIAHDLNNVLAPVGMAATVLRSKISDQGSLSLLDTLERCAERGAGLVRQIVGFAHGIGGEPRLIQVKHLLRDIAGLVSETFPKSIEFKDDVPGELWPIVANPTQIHQVLLNLCVNARDAMPQGGTLRLRAENVALDGAAARDIPGARAGAWLVLQVGDNGTGIAPEVRPRIWDPFFTTKSADKGTGLGLSTVRGIVETHHGFITLQTEPGRGTSFSVYLPATETAGDGDKRDLPTPFRQGNGELILVVDDEEPIRRLVHTVLSARGYRVIAAADGIEALALFETCATELALIITDLDMPNVDGVALARCIRAYRPDFKILTMSGHANQHLRAQLDGFVAAFLAKPFPAAKLLQQVQQLLHRPAKRSS